MNNFSTTQATNITAIIGVFIIVLKYLHINIAESELQELVGAIIAAIGIIMNFWHRYKKGDLRIIGVRK